MPTDHWRRAGAWWVALLTSFACTGASADPVSAIDRYPLARMFAAPAPTVADYSRSVSGVELIGEWGTFATVSTGVDETLVFDGEFVTLTGRWLWQRNGWRLGLDVPVSYQSGGTLDGLIDDFHQLLNLPEGDRPQLAQDEFLVRYTDSRGTRFDVRGDDWGFGETTLHVGRALGQSNGRYSAWRAHLKLPTGSTRRLLGSGTVGLGVEWHGLARSEWRGRALTWFGGGGVQWHDGSEVLSDRVERWAVLRTRRRAPLPAPGAVCRRAARLPQSVF